MAHSIRFRLVAAGALTVLGGLPGARPATLVVDDDPGAAFTSIQQAIDAAVPGVDDVFVRCGTYAENVVMRSEVSLRGQHPACTVIDGAYLGPAVTIEGAAAGTTLEGFSIVHGRAQFGGGVRVRGGQPTITGNVIRDNGQALFTGLYNSGGGIYVAPGTDPATAPTISYNVIRDNEAYDGGGIYVIFSAGAVLTSNLIVGNVGSFGGGLSINGGDNLVINNTIAGNRGDYGGGMWIYHADAQITNNVFTGNEGLGSAGDFYGAGPSNLVWTANASFGNTPYDILPFSEPGTIDQDPGFVDQKPTFSGFGLRSDSPLIDAGSATGAPGRDLLGVVRPIDGDADGSDVVDLGARENAGITGLLHDGGGFAWDEGRHVSALYHVYRGDLGELLSTGAYTQDPALDPRAAHVCSLAGTSWVDGDLPAANETFFYLVAAAGAVEGTLGLDGELNERLPTLSCPSP